MRILIPHVVDATGWRVAKELCLRPNFQRRGGGLGGVRANEVIQGSVAVQQHPPKPLVVNRPGRKPFSIHLLFNDEPPNGSAIAETVVPEIARVQATAPPLAMDLLVLPVSFVQESAVPAGDVATVVH